MDAKKYLEDIALKLHKFRVEMLCDMPEENESGKEASQLMHLALCDMQSAIHHLRYAALKAK